MRDLLYGCPLGLLGAIVVALVVTATTEATTTAPLRIADLAAHSDLVVVGAVSSVESGWNAAGTVIETQVHVHVAATPKGAPRPDVVVWQPGGRIGTLAAEFADMPRFSPGERVLLFLRQARDGRYRVVGLFQGKFSIERDATTGEERAVRRVPDTGDVVDAAPLDRVLAELTTGR